MKRLPPPPRPARLPAARPAAQADRARRMRLVATSMLAAMAIVFVIALRFEHLHPAVGYVVAFAEAAMVGGLADWFAVTALFRHPLGVPIPHTAIIPEKKDRIADTMAGFLRANFLTPTVVARRMRGMNLARAIGDFLAEPRPAGPSRIREGAAGLLAEMLESLDPERLGNQVKAGLARQIERMDLAPVLGNALSAAIADGRHRPMLEGLIRWAGVALERNEEMVRSMIQARANALLRWTGLDGKVANSVLDGLYRLLAEVLVDPEHPLRKTVEEGLEKLAHDLVHDPETREKVEALKRDVLANPAAGDWWMGVWERMRLSLIEMVRDPEAALGGQLGESLAELGRSLQNDPALQWQVNRLARRTVVGLVTRYGEQIAQLVSETVRRWDTGTLTSRLENAVGRDLQFIRINGTLVGGLVGVTIHALSQWL